MQIETMLSLQQSNLNNTVCLFINNLVNKIMLSLYINSCSNIYSLISWPIFLYCPKWQQLSSDISLQHGCCIRCTYVPHKLICCITNFLCHRFCSHSDVRCSCTQNNFHNRSFHISSYILSSVSQNYHSSFHISSYILSSMSSSSSYTKSQNWLRKKSSGG